jgi:ABC-type dipeptide/oligopeptide/nickel transport system permease component
MGLAGIAFLLLVAYGLSTNRRAIRLPTVLWGLGLQLTLAVFPQLMAVAAMSVSLAFGAALPLEVVLDSPGIGHLAWNAAMSRDMPVLVAVTLMVTLMVKVAAMATGMVQESPKELPA